MYADFVLFLVHVFHLCRIRLDTSDNLEPTYFHYAHMIVFLICGGRNGDGALFLGICLRHAGPMVETGVVDRLLRPRASAAFKSVFFVP